MPTYEPLKRTQRSKELTDKIHRLVRRFSRDLVELVSQEIGARAVRIPQKGGPKKGVPAPRRECPLCLQNHNGMRYRNYVCFECRPKSWKYHRPKGRDKVGDGFKVVVPVFEGPLNPKDVEVEDVEPDFLDRLIEVVPTEPATPKAPTVKATTTEDEDFFA